ncbi:MAG: prephenate dehydrogenase [Bdellovibrionia bacterium]
MRVAIIGLGLIGSSLASDLKRVGFAHKIVGMDSNLAHRQEAFRLGWADRVYDFDPSFLKTQDLILLATPVNVIANLLPQVLDQISAGTTVTDVGSTKEQICRAVLKHPKRSQFVPAHPMAGTENSGPGAAISRLFEGKTTVICDSENSDEFHLNRVLELYASLNSRVVLMSSVDHDFHAAFVSHLSHLSSFALANTVLAEEKQAATIFDLAGGGFESTVRLGKSSPDMWTPIFDHNRKNILLALESYQNQLEKFRQYLFNEDWNQLRELMTHSNEIRKVLQSFSQRSEKRSEP